MKALIMFYSYEGNTRRIAKLIANHVNGDIEEIKPKNERKAKGVSKYVWGCSQVFMGKKPEIMPTSKNMDDYDLIFVGTPIWAYTYAPPVKTILEDEYIKGKKIAFFCTHDGGPGKIEERAKRVIEKNNTFISFKDLDKTKGDFEMLEQAAIHWVDEIMMKMDMK